MSKTKNIVAAFDSGIIVDAAKEETTSKGTSVHIFIRVKKHKHVCPDCASESAWINDSGRNRKIHHLPQSRRPCIVHVHQNHYRCTECGRTFFEQFDWLCKGLNMTVELFRCILGDLSHISSKKEIGRMNGISEYLVNKVAMTADIPFPSSPPEIVCLDEAKADVKDYNPENGNRKRIRFITNFSDGATGQVIDILGFKTKKKLAAYFKKTFSPEELQKVRFVCSDMGKQYLFLANECFPNAIVCLDYYHVIKRLNDAMDRVRSRLQDKLLKAGDTEAYKDLKGLRTRLCTSASHQRLYWGDNYDRIVERLRKAFERFPDLKDAYAMLHYFHEIYDTFPFFEKRRAMLSLWIARFKDSLVDEIRSAVKTISEHIEYIHNAWKYGLSNATSEGNNNVFKTIKKCSFGVRYFGYLRRRVLLVCSRPGISRGRAKIILDPPKPESSFFYKDFPGIEEYTFATDLTYVNS